MIPDICGELLSSTGITQLAGLGHRAMPLRAVKFEDKLDLQVTLDPFEHFGFDMGAIPRAGVGLRPEFYAAQLDPLAIDQITERDTECAGKRQQDPGTGDILAALVFPDSLGRNSAVHGVGQTAQGIAGLAPGEFDAVSNHGGPPFQFTLAHFLYLL